MADYSIGLNNLGLKLLYMIGGYKKSQYFMSSIGFYVLLYLSLEELYQLLF